MKLKILITIFIFLIKETLSQQETIENIEYQDGSDDQQAIIQQGPRYILKLQLNETTNEIYTQTHIGSPPIERKMKIKVEGNVTFVKCYDCQTDELNLFSTYNKKNKYPLNNHNCSTALNTYYEIQSSGTGSIYNCLHKQYRQQHNCDHCGKQHRCEYNYTHSDGTIETGFYGEDYFLLNENLDLEDFHYIQLNEARTRFPLVCLYNYTEETYQGEFGLGENRRDRGKWMNFVSNLYNKKQNVSDTFDFCLHSKIEEYEDEIGFIMFGEDTMEKTSDFYIDYDKNTEGLYYSNLTQITINEEENNYDNITAIFSTGHANLKAPQSMVENIQRLVKNHIQGLQQFYGRVQQENDQLCFIKENNVEHTLFYSQFPEINLHFSQTNLNQNITWMPEHYLLQDLYTDQNRFCLALEIYERQQTVQILTKDQNNRQVTFNLGERQIVELGYKIFEGYRVQFDRQAQKIFFEVGDCIFAETAKDFVFYNQYNPDQGFYVLVTLASILGFLILSYLGYHCIIKTFRWYQNRKNKKNFKRFKDNQDNNNF